MTTTLQDIIEKCDEITTEAEQLGFINVNIHNDIVNESNPIFELTFVVTVNPENFNASDIYATHLAASIRKTLACDVTIMVSSRIKPHFVEHVEKYSVSINNCDAVTKLFETNNPKNIMFAEVPVNSQQKDRRTLGNIKYIKGQISKASDNNSHEKKSAPHSLFT